MLLGILLTIHIIVCICLIAVVLMQRSEGGALGMGGGPSGFMSARGAGDLLTRTTWILGTIFFILSLALTLLSGRERASDSVVDRMKIESLDPSKLNQPTQACNAYAELESIYGDKIRPDLRKLLSDGQAQAQCR